MRSFRCFSASFFFVFSNPLLAFGYVELPNEPYASFVVRRYYLSIVSLSLLFRFIFVKPFLYGSKITIGWETNKLKNRLV